MTRASATPGSSISTRSTSAGSTLRPATLTSVETRPVSTSRPRSSKQPRSPVRNPPSAKPASGSLARSRRRRRRPRAGRQTARAGAGSGRDDGCRWSSPASDVRRQRLGDLVAVVVRDAARFTAAVEGMDLPSERSLKPATVAGSMRAPAVMSSRSGAGSRVDVQRTQAIEHERHAGKHGRARGFDVGDELRGIERLPQRDGCSLKQQRHHDVAERVRSATAECTRN